MTTTGIWEPGRVNSWPGGTSTTGSTPAPGDWNHTPGSRSARKTRIACGAGNEATSFPLIRDRPPRYSFLSGFYEGAVVGVCHALAARGCSPAGRSSERAAKAWHPTAPERKPLGTPLEQTVEKGDFLSGGLPSSPSARCGATQIGRAHV